MIDNYHMEKYDSYTKRCYYYGGAEGSFDYIADEVKQYITEFTFIVHRPVFSFPNGIIINMEYSDNKEELRWKYRLNFGDFKTDWMLDINFKNFSPQLYCFSDLLRCFLLISKKDVEAWTKTLNNPRRKTWKTSEEFLTSKKFRDAFEKVLPKAIEDGRNNDPFRFPDEKSGFSKPKLDKEIKPSEYKSRNVFNDELVFVLTGYKWRNKYSLTIETLEDTNEKFISIDFKNLPEVMSFVEKSKEMSSAEIKRQFSETISTKEKRG